MTRGIGSVLHSRELLSPIRHGAFAWMVFSHKLCRWLAPLAVAVGFAAVLLLTPRAPWARWLAFAGGITAALGTIGWAWPEYRDAPRFLAIPAYVLAANVAAINAWLNVLIGKKRPVWSPTRRGSVEVAE